MNLKDQCCTLSQAKRLKELGVTAKSIFSWNGYSYPDYAVGYTEDLKDDEYNAYTVAELGVMLPDFLVFDNYRCHFHSYKQEQHKSPALWTCTYGKSTDREVNDFDSHIEAQARASLLIHLLERELIPPSEVNNQLNQ
jgi:hypothetical protein